MLPISFRFVLISNILFHWVTVEFTKLNDFDLIVLVGSPGAGKSTFVKRHLVTLGYERINQDTLGTKEKCLEIATRYLETKKSVVIGT